MGIGSAFRDLERRQKGRRRRGAPRRLRNLKKPRQGFQGSLWSPNIPLCPDRMFVKLKFAETTDLTLGSPAFKYAIYRGNCHIDCNAGSVGVGASAYGAEAWSNFYNRCYCTASSIRVQALSLDSVISQVVVFPSNTSFVPTQLNAAVERARSKSMFLNGNATSKTFLTHKATSKAVIGEPWDRDQSYRSDTTVTATFPSSDFYWTIVQQLVSGASTTVSYNVIITYNVVFYDRRPILGTSTEGSSS